MAAPLVQKRDHRYVTLWEGGKPAGAAAGATELPQSRCGGRHGSHAVCQPVDTAPCRRLPAGGTGGLQPHACNRGHVSPQSPIGGTSRTQTGTHGRGVAVPGPS